MAAQEINTLESEEREFWMEGGRCGIHEKGNEILSSSGWSLIVLNICEASSDTPIRVPVSMT